MLNLGAGWGRVTNATPRSGRFIPGNEGHYLPSGVDGVPVPVWRFWSRKTTSFPSGFEPPPQCSPQQVPDSLFSPQGARYPPPPPQAVYYPAKQVPPYANSTILIFIHRLQYSSSDRLPKKRIPSIFNDESTGSFICLRRHIYMSHVNKVQLIRVNMICVAVIRAFQPIVVQKMWMLAAALTTYVSFCIV
jgi:hypothetical protein